MNFIDWLEMNLGQMCVSCFQIYIQWSLVGTSGRRHNSGSSPRYSQIPRNTTCPTVYCLFMFCLPPLLWPSHRDSQYPSAGDQEKNTRFLGPGAARQT